MCVSGDRDVYVVSDREPDHCIYQHVRNFAFVVFVGRNLVFSARLGAQRNDRNPFDPDTDRCLYLSYDEKLDACGRIEAVGSAAALIVYFVKSSLYENLLTKLLGRLALADVFMNISSSNIVDVSGLLLYVSILIIFVFLTIQTIQKRRWS